MAGPCSRAQNPACMDALATDAAHRPPVWLSLGLSMVLAGAVYPVTAFALDSTTPITIATLRALLGGVLLTLVLPLFGSRLPRSRQPCSRNRGPPCRCRSRPRRRSIRRCGSRPPRR